MINFRLRCPELQNRRFGMRTLASGSFLRADCRPHGDARDHPITGGAGLRKHHSRRRQCRDAAGDRARQAWQDRSRPYQGRLHSAGGWAAADHQVFFAGLESPAHAWTARRYQSQPKRVFWMQERNASRSFLDQMLVQEKDKAFLIHFDREVELLQDLTHPRKAAIGTGIAEDAITIETGPTIPRLDDSGQARKSTAGLNSMTRFIWRRMNC